MVQNLGKDFTSENVTGETGFHKEFGASNRMAAGVSRSANWVEKKGEGDSHPFLQLFGFFWLFFFFGGGGVLFFF